MTTALNGLRVVEIGGNNYVLPYATKLLGDLGADILLAEPSSGHPLRRGRPDSIDSDVFTTTVFDFLNSGKQSVVVDPSRSVQKDEIKRLLTWADIIVDGWGELDKHGFDSDTVERLNPHAVLVRVSDWGDSGPHHDLPVTPLTLQAAAGWVTDRNEPGLRPVQVGALMHEWVAGSYLAAAMLTARRAALKNKRFTVAEFSVFECIHSTLPYPSLMRDTYAELGLDADAPQYTPFGVRPCKDGWVGINILTAQHWHDACQATGLSEYIGFQQQLTQGHAGLEEFERRLCNWLMERTVNEVVEIGQGLRIPFVPVSSAEDIHSIGQWQERPFFSTSKASSGSYRHPGPPWRLSLTPARQVNDTAKADNEIPANGKYTVKGKRDEVKLPFEGLRVIDLGSFWAAPYFTSYLGAYGADVIKIESIQRPDGFRYTLTDPKLGSAWYDRSLLWQATNLNKRSVTLDLGSEDGRAILADLCKTADIFVENYAAHVVENFGFDFEHLHALNPSMVVVRLPGFGLRGPWRDYVGWGNAFEQVAGLASATGYPDDAPKTPGGYIDPVVGMNALVALTAALDHRDRTQEGQLVEVPQIEVGASLAATEVIRASIAGQDSARHGNRTSGYAPQGVYRCHGSAKEFIALSARDEREWLRLVEIMGDPEELRAESLNTVQERIGLHDYIDTVIEGWTQEHEIDELLVMLHEAGIPAARLLRPEDFNDEPQLLSRGFYQELTHPLSGTRKFPRYPMQFSFEAEDQGPHRFPAPTLGQHNRSVLCDELGISETVLEFLKETGVIGTAPLGKGGD